MGKKVLFLIVAFGIFFMGFSTLASPKQGTISLDYLEPSVLQVYRPHVWSSTGKWDLRELKSIPDDAVVTFIRIEWEVLTAGGFGGMEVALGYQIEENEENEENVKFHIFLLNKSSTEKFEGISPRQKWEVGFRVSYWERRGIPLQLTINRLVIGWKVPDG